MHCFVSSFGGGGVLYTVGLKDAWSLGGRGGFFFQMINHTDIFCKKKKKKERKKE